MGCLYFCTVRGRSRRTCLEDFPATVSQFRDRSAVFRSRFSKCQSERTAAAFGMSAEKKNGGGACCDDFAVTALSFVLRLGGTDVLVVSALVTSYYKWKSSKYFGGITGRSRRLFSLCELAQLLSLVVLSE